MQETERRELAERIASTAGDLGGKLTDIVGALRTGRATLGLLAAELAERATQLVPGPAPELRIEYPERWPDQEIVPTLRHDLRLIALEAVHNAVRHAGARQITLHLKPAGRHWLLRVADDGCGFSEGTPREGGGLGLPGMRRRAERNGARLTVLHPPGGGTIVEVSFEPNPHHIMI
jgi:signal transduction histidine kinase